MVNLMSLMAHTVIIEDYLKAKVASGDKARKSVEMEFPKVVITTELLH